MRKGHKTVAHGISLRGNNKDTDNSLTNMSIISGSSKTVFFMVRAFASNMVSIKTKDFLRKMGLSKALELTQKEMSHEEYLEFLKMRMKSCSFKAPKLTKMEMSHSLETLFQKFKF